MFPRQRHNFWDEDAEEDDIDPDDYPLGVTIYW
jgi:hypothetical protein